MFTLSVTQHGDDLEYRLSDETHILGGRAKTPDDLVSKVKAALNGLSRSGRQFGHPNISLESIEIEVSDDVRKAVTRGLLGTLN